MNYYEKMTKYVARANTPAWNFIADKAKGAVIEDEAGHKYLDFYSGVGVLNAGHCPEPVVEAAKKQLEKLIHTDFSVTMYRSYIDLAEKLINITPGSTPKKISFFNSGAEAVENAIKISRFYTKRQGIISFECAFHGRTLLTMSLTSKIRPYKVNFGPFAPEIYKVPSAYCYRCAFNSTYPGCGLHCLEYIERFFVTGADAKNIAAMIIEPIQGEGGIIVQPKEFLKGLKEICEREGIVFIADEVQTGFCRTGKMFAVENYNIAPDILTLAKSIASGFPLSAVVSKTELIDAPAEGNLGTTYGGNAVACAAANATIDFMIKENLASRAIHIGEVMMKRLKDLQEKSPIIGDVRGMGAMVGVEFVEDKKTKKPAKDKVQKITKFAYENGLLLIGAGIYGNAIRVYPPLVISDDELEKGLSILERAIMSA